VVENKQSITSQFHQKWPVQASQQIPAKAWSIDWGFNYAQTCWKRNKCLRLLPSGYLTVCHGSHGPFSSMIYDDLPIIFLVIFYSYGTNHQRVSHARGCVIKHSIPVHQQVPTSIIICWYFMGRYDSWAGDIYKIQ
jgi:hypothetical protein